MRMPRFKLFIFIVLLAFNACWKEQHHEITAPVIPSYNLLGTVIDIDDLTAVPGCSLMVRPVALLYEDSTYSGHEIVCDSLGQFEASGLIPGTYSIVTYRDGFDMTSEIMMMGHEDRQIEIKLPKVLVARTRYSVENLDARFNIPQIDGIEWLDDGDAIIVTPSNGEAHFLAKGRPGDMFYGIGNPDSIAMNPEFWGLTFLESFWVGGGNLFDYRLYALDTVTGTIIDQIDTEYQVMDLTNDGEALMVTSAIRKVLRYDIHTKTKIASHDLGFENPGGIATSGSEIWISGSADHYIFQFDPEMNPEKTYRPVYIDDDGNRSWMGEIKYLSFDSKGRLWATDGMNLYKF